MTAKKYSDINFYEILGINIEAEEAEIRKAYRKKALECHPDKNPDNPKAVELFLELSKALEILTDISARSAYDNVLKAKKATELRNKQLDSKRQKLKADLEQRERDAFNKILTKQEYCTVSKSDEEILQEQIERIRREGSRLLEEEQKFLKEQLQRTFSEHMNPNQTTFDSAQHRIKIKWKADKKDSTNGGYTQEQLLMFLKKYGDVEGLVMSKKNGSALVEFKTLEAAEMALSYEKGLLNNPLQLEWLTTPPDKVAAQNGNRSALDYEDLVMRKLRQAEERKRLIEQMVKEEQQQ